MNNGYPILEWSPGVSIVDDDEDKRKFYDSMEHIVYDVRAEPYDEYDQYNEENKDDVDDEWCSLWRRW